MSRKQQLLENVNMMHIFSFLLVLLMFVIICTGLAGSHGSRKTMEEVAPGVVQAFENDRALKSGERIFKKYYGLNPGDYEEVLLYFPLTNMDPQELLIIRLEDPSQAKAVTDAIKERQESQIRIYEGYAPEQLALCQNGIIDVRGNYILYVVHEDAAQIDQIFRSSL